MAAKPSPPAPTIPEPDGRRLWWLRHPLRWTERKFLLPAAPMSAYPLVVLFFIYFADEFDTAAFSTLAPEIRDAFGLTDQQFLSIVGINFVLIVLLTVPLGWWADRTNRVNLVVVSAVVAVTFSFLTGLSWAVGILLLARIGNGLGLIANWPVHNSLLADYYLPDSRPEVFSRHRSAQHVGAIVGPIVAGLIGYLIGWRWAFFIMAIPIAVATVFALRMREPVRGGTDSPDDAFDASFEDPVSFRASVRLLWRVPTLRRQYIGTIFVGAAYIPLLTFLSLYLEDMFGVNELGRGAVGCLNAAAGFVGTLWAGRLTRTRWLAKGIGEPQKWLGYILLIVTVNLVLLAAIPVLGLVIPVGMAAYFLGGMFFPPYLTVTALVSPARVRSQGFTFSLLFLGLGAIPSLIISGGISDAHGIQWGIASLTPYWIIGALIVYSAHKFVEGDTNKAFQDLHDRAEQHRLEQAAAAPPVL